MPSKFVERQLGIRNKEDIIVYLSLQILPKRKYLTALFHPLVHYSKIKALHGMKEPARLMTIIKIPGLNKQDRKRSWKSSQTLTTQSKLPRAWTWSAAEDSISPN